MHTGKIIDNARGAKVAETYMQGVLGGKEEVCEETGCQEYHADCAKENVQLTVSEL